MKYALFLFAIFFLSSTCSARDGTDKISVENAVSDCIKFKKNQLEFVSNIVVLDTTWEMISNIGSCGCKSAALKYDVKTTSGHHVSKGYFSTFDRRSFKFVIDSDKSIYKRSNYTLLVNCG